MAAILDQQAAMSSYLHLLTSGLTPQHSLAGYPDDWDLRQLDSTAFLEDASRDQVYGLEVSDYMCFDDDGDDENLPQPKSAVDTQPDFAGECPADGASGSGHEASIWTAAGVDGAGLAVVRDGAGERVLKRKKDGSPDCTRKRIGFRTKAEVDVLDDGYKWRKYGKKSVKNSPNPRNYYKCSCQGCNVKKRVERDSQDSSYVLTIYEGVHNHASPSSATTASARFNFIENSLCGNSAAAWLSSGGGSWSSSNPSSWDMNTIEFSFC